MKGIKLFSSAVVLALLLGFSAMVHAQTWTFQGFVTGAGTFPSISVYNPTSLIIIGGPAGTPKVFKSTNSDVTFTDISGNLVRLDRYCGWAGDGNVMNV